MGPMLSAKGATALRQRRRDSAAKVSSRCCSSRHWCTSSGVRLKWAKLEVRIARACHSRDTVVSVAAPA
eukprot:scaffold88837_cov63-Phaeocystis_antarctica.AAC.3